MFEKERRILGGVLSFVVRGPKVSEKPDEFRELGSPRRTEWGGDPFCPPSRGDPIKIGATDAGEGPVFGVPYHLLRDVAQIFSRTGDATGTKEEKRQGQMCGTTIGCLFAAPLRILLMLLLRLPKFPTVLLHLQEDTVLSRFPLVILSGSRLHKCSSPLATRKQKKKKGKFEAAPLRGGQDIFERVYPSANEPGHLSVSYGLEDKGEKRFFR